MMQFFVNLHTSLCVQILMFINIILVLKSRFLLDIMLNVDVLEVKVHDLEITLKLVDKKIQPIYAHDMARINN